VIDWSLARRIADTVAGDDGASAALPGDLAALCADAQVRVTAYTQLQPLSPLPAPEAVGRSAWLEANLAGMAGTLEPVLERMGSGAGPLGPVVRAGGGLVLAAEVGALTGYLAQRVLGQYELALLDPVGPARLLFVAPNIVASSERLEADLPDLLAWIALHEVTHGVQFTAVPWLREHLGGLMRELLEGLDVKLDPAKLLQLPGPDDLRGLVDAVRDQGLVGVFAGGERRELLDRLQAVMALIEGHAEHVMDAVGKDVVSSLPHLRGALDRRRRERPPLLALLERLIGLELKMRQYELGKRFCDAVVARGGIEELNRAFSAPDAIPTLAQLQDPQSWRL
jgi:coenzyme F420 biosynthesis associated uncharacterized protein